MMSERRILHVPRRDAQFRCRPRGCPPASSLHRARRRLHGCQHFPRRAESHILLRNMMCCVVGCLRLSRLSQIACGSVPVPSCLYGCQQCLRRVNHCAARSLPCSGWPGRLFIGSRACSWAYQCCAECCRTQTQAVALCARTGKRWCTRRFGVSAVVRRSGPGGAHRQTCSSTAHSCRGMLTKHMNLHVVILKRLLCVHEGMHGTTKAHPHELH